MICDHEIIAHYFSDLNRQKLVALGILLGCDYLPQGVAGIGKQKAMKLIKNVNHDNLIDRCGRLLTLESLSKNITACIHVK